MSFDMTVTTIEALYPKENSSDALEQNSQTREAKLQAELDLYRDIFRRLVSVASEAADGNLEARLLHLDDSENFRELARSVNHLLDMTDAFLREAGAALEHASQGKFFRRVLVRGMRGAFRDKSELINEATGNLARNAASLHEVERLVSNSAGIAQNAVREATDAIIIMGQLGEASQRIGHVVKSISQIAWQTKLLAFNAKIEAGRAGEAGRGFDVVAQEVKNLAQQTDIATSEISREIVTIQAEVERSAKAMDVMSRTISQMSEISATIEHAVGEQTNKKFGHE